MAEGHRVSRHISTMCGRVGAGEPTFESYSVGKHSAAAPAVVSAHSQLSATRLATLLHAARRWVHLLLAQVVGCCRLVASPIALVELYRTGHRSGTLWQCAVDESDMSGTQRRALGRT